MTKKKKTSRRHPHSPAHATPCHHRSSSSTHRRPTLTTGTHLPLRRAAPPSRPVVVVVLMRHPSLEGRHAAQTRGEEAATATSGSGGENRDPSLKPPRGRRAVGALMEHRVCVVAPPSRRQMCQGPSSGTMMSRDSRAVTRKRLPLRAPTCRTRTVHWSHCQYVALDDASSPWVERREPGSTPEGSRCDCKRPSRWRGSG